MYFFNSKYNVKKRSNNQENVSLKTEINQHTLIMEKIIIAIDGFSSCGKSTMAKELARQIGYVHIDSGAMYRAVTLYAISRGYFKNGILDKDSLLRDMPQIHITFKFIPEEKRTCTFLNGENVEEEIRNMEVSSKVSPVAELSFVREIMVAQQRKMGIKKGIIMDGRDIGTTVFPQAELKIFVTCSPEIRAERRYKELVEKGQDTSFDEVLENVKQRDYIDQHREISPLKMANDALILDNGKMTPEEQNHWLLERVNEATNGFRKSH